MEYTIRKTKPKEGLPNGAWVCFNHSLDEYLQLFGDTPEEALNRYLEKQK